MAPSSWISKGMVIGIIFIALPLILYYYVQTIPVDQTNKVVDSDTEDWRNFDNVDYFYLFPSSHQPNILDSWRDLTDFKFIHMGYHNENKYYFNGERYIFKHNRSNGHCWAFQPQLNDSFIGCNHSLYSTTFVVGDYVLYYKPTLKYTYNASRHKKKYIQGWDGPYKIIDIKLDIRNSTYRIGWKVITNRMIYTLDNGQRSLIKNLKLFHPSSKYCDPNELCLQSTTYTAIVKNGLYLKNGYIKINSVIIIPGLEIPKCIKTNNNKLFDLNNAQSFWIWNVNSSSYAHNKNGKWIYNGTYNDSPYYYNSYQSHSIFASIQYLFSVKKKFWVAKLMEDDENEENIPQQYCYYDQNCWKMGIKWLGGDGSCRGSAQRNCVFCKDTYGYTPLQDTYNKELYWSGSYESPNWIQCDQITFKLHDQRTYIFTKNNTDDSHYLYCRESTRDYNVKSYDIHGNIYQSKSHAMPVSKCITYIYQTRIFGWIMAGGWGSASVHYETNINVPFLKGQTVSNVWMWEEDLPDGTDRPWFYYERVNMSCM